MGNITISGLYKGLKGKIILFLIENYVIIKVTDFVNRLRMLLQYEALITKIRDHYNHKSNRYWGGGEHKNVKKCNIILRSMN